MTVFIVLCCTLLPIFMTGIGLLWKNHAPKNINYLYGYRTPRSMKNRETWAFAHAYIGRLWRIIGPAMLAATLVLLCLFAESPDFCTLGGALSLVQIAALIITIVPTEAALRRHFGPDGTPRP